MTGIDATANIAASTSAAAAAAATACSGGVACLKDGSAVDNADEFAPRRRLHRCSPARNTLFQLMHEPCRADDRLASPWLHPPPEQLT